jgi:hypothetical protein
MAYGTVNADIIGTSVAGSNLGAGNASTLKNRIINGAMMINQRGFSGSVASGGVYTLDRFQAWSTVSSKYTIAQSSTAPAGFINSLLITSSSAYTVGASELYAINQNIEGLNISDLGWGTANAKTVTLSFQVYSSLTGTFGGSLTNSAQNRSYPFTYTVSSANTWTQISITIAGDTTGTWLTTNGTGISLFIGLGVGSTLSGTAGSWSGSTYYSATGATSVVGTNGATFYITGVQLEVGSSATGFEYRQYGTELALCQRYYVQNFQGTWGQTYNTSVALFSLKCPVPMRINNPSYGQVSGVALSADIVGGGQTASSSAVTGTGQSALVTPISYSGLSVTTYQPVGIANVGSYLSAEL